jgi:uncharacterized SAM-binding protein YcdF (DUF218 family)
VFYIASKLFWLVAQPINLAALLLLASPLLVAFRWRRTGLALGAAAFLVIALSAWTSLGALLLHPLEDRFARPAEPPENVDGIIVLGGGFEGGINLVRGGYELNSGGDRFVEAAILARHYPQARILISGGTGTLILQGEGDAETAPRLLEALGVPPERLILENRSRNTHENAVFSRELVDPAPGETWILVTSAFHMPRSVALFRRAAFDVVPWPTDYRTTGNERPGLAQDNPLDSLQNVTIAVREWIGLLAYRITGRTDEILPARE